MQVYIKDISEADRDGLSDALYVSKYSKCLSRKVGAVIHSAKGRSLAFGWNKPPLAIASCAINGSCSNNAKGQCTRCRHAEIKAIGSYETFHADATIYITCPPCHSCALEIIHAGISRVVCYTHPKTDAEAINRLLEAGVEYIEVMP